MSGTPLWNRLAPFGRWCTLLSCSSCSGFQTFESCCSCSCISTCEQADQRCACWQSKLDRTQASERPGTDLSSSTKDSIASFDLHDPVLSLTLKVGALVGLALLTSDTGVRPIFSSTVAWLERQRQPPGAVFQSTMAGSVKALVQSKKSFWSNMWQRHLSFSMINKHQLIAKACADHVLFLHTPVALFEVDSFVIESSTYPMHNFALQVAQAQVSAGVKAQVSMSVSKLLMAVPSKLFLKEELDCG